MNILLVRLRLIGDVVFTTPVIAALRRAYPSARLTYLVEPAAAPVVASNPHLDDVIVVPTSRGWRRMRDDLQWAWRLRARQFDLAIDLHGGPRSAWLTWASRARVRVGYDVPGRSWMYTRIVDRPRTYRPRHAVANQWDLLAAVNDSIDAAPTRVAHPVEMWVDRTAADSARTKLEALGVPAGAELILVHVSAGNPFRRWPEAEFASLASRLVSTGARRWVVLTAGPSDRDATRRIVSAARQQAGVAAERVVTADNLSLAELRATMDRTAVFIGGDSGPLHIAATSHAPIVGIYGPTLAERSQPWRAPEWPTRAVEPGPLPCRPCDQRTCAPGDFRCLTSVSAAGVARAAEELLEATR